MLDIAPYDKAAKVALRDEIEKTNPLAEFSILITVDGKVILYSQ